MDINENEKIWFFLFINSKSGGQVGKQYLTIDNHKITYQYGKDTSVYIHFVDLFDQEQRNNALRKIRKAQDKVRRLGKGRIHAVVCGGDGTVLWVVSIIDQFGIDFNQITFCIIPIGTGNDFSRCLGWGGSPISFSKGRVQQLKLRLLEWLQGQQSWFDIWHANVSIHQDGEIIQIRDKRQVKMEAKQYSRGFVNYLGIGIDARICYNVQMNRQKNKWFNLGLYACIGLCKYFQRIRPTHEAIHSFEQSEPSYKGREHQQSTSKESPLMQNQDKEKAAIRLKPGYSSLLALNSVRYMAGLKNVWNTNKLGIKTTENPPKFEEQRFDDGKIQFIAFKNELRLALERIGNFATRVAQGQGPFVLQFNRTENNSSTYIHIDGQPMRIRQLKEISIRKSTIALQGRIKVLTNKN